VVLLQDHIGIAPHDHTVFAQCGNPFQHVLLLQKKIYLAGLQLIDKVYYEAAVPGRSNGDRNQ
ncbi:MAG: hypothetical protein IJ268_12350, partial [Proteobacteria bacterium]|nr:hypothetical protein [Pseudomonadota bacterium]